MRYLLETLPDPALFGSTAKDRALVTMWERRMELEGFAAVMEEVRNTVPSLKGRALAGPHCVSARGFDADRHNKLFIY